MKRKNLIFAILPVLMAVFAMQSCTKSDDSNATIYYAFTEPTVVAPLDAALIKISGTTVELKWAATDADGDAPKCDVYFSTDSEPKLYKANHNALSLTVPVELGATYHWKVTMKDANGVMTYGPTWSFTIFEPIGIFVGNYNVDEPAEDWTYDVSFKKLTANTLKIGNGAGKYDGWWASWPAVFTLDFAKNTYSMPKTDFGGGYEGVESGTINQTTGTMVGNYTIWQTKAGVTKIIEEGVHTYTKK